MATPTLKSNAGDQRVCKKKNLSWFFGVDKKIRPSGSLFGITPHLSSMKDSSNLTHVILSMGRIFFFFCEFSVHLYKSKFHGVYLRNITSPALTLYCGGTQKVIARTLAPLSPAHPRRCVCVWGGGVRAGQELQMTGA